MSDATDTAIAQLQQDVAALTDAEGKAVALLNGLAAQLQAATTAALNRGATAAQLSELSDLHAAITVATAGLVDAVTADTVPDAVSADPAQPPPADAPPPVVDTPPPAPDTTPAATGDDTVSATTPAGDDSLTGAVGDDTLTPPPTTTSSKSK